MNTITDKNTLVVGDIHGEYELFNKLLDNFDYQEDRLVLIGDLIDRGPQVLDTIRTAQQLVESEVTDVIALKGNHEDMLTNFINKPDQANLSLYLTNGGASTLTSMYSEEFVSSYSLKPLELALELQKDYQSELDFIKNMPVYYKNNNLVCVHAGISTHESNFINSTDEEFLWTRDNFEAGKLKIIHGHTPHFGPIDVSHNILNIDTGAVFGGRLTGVKLNPQNDVIEIYQVNNNYDLLVASF